MINAELLGRRIAEAIVYRPGPCFYPGRFKPPHKGHYAAAADLASKPFVEIVNVLISSKVVQGITPEDSLKIWQMYLQAQPNPKIKVKIAAGESPINDIVKAINSTPAGNPVYVSVGDTEEDDEEYGKALKERYGDKVEILKVHEKAGDITAPYVREVLVAGDYEAFKEAIPEAAFNKGAAPKIFDMLISKITP